jgi:hypothetical protein
MPEITAPPKWILLLLWPFRGELCYPQIEGDLSEEFHQREVEHGMSSARQWYYREVCRNFWSMIWRWVTIPVIIVPLVCMVLADFLHFPIFWRMYSAWHLKGFILGIVIDSLPIASIIGLSLGIICSLMLRGHERLVGLAFGAYQLVTLIMQIVTAKVFGPSPVIRTFLLGLIYLKPICTLVFFGMGSTWIERRDHRRRAA